MDISKYEYLRLPVKDTWGVLMRRDSPLAVKDHILAEDLWEKPLLVSHQIYDSSELSSWFQRDIRKLHITAAYELVYNATHFVKSGCGYALSLDKLINTTGESDLPSAPCTRPWMPACALSGKNTRSFPGHPDSIWTH